MRRDAAAHRLAADEHLIPCKCCMVAGGSDRRAIAGLEHVGAIGQLAPLLCIQEVEGEHVNTSVGEPIAEPHHEAARLTGAGP